MRISQKTKRAFKCALRDTVPVMIAFVVLGTGYGILMRSKGVGWAWPGIMSLVIFAGSMQYVSVELISNGDSLISAALMTLAVNFRHLFYGVSMLEKYKNMGARKPALIFGLCDETFSLVCFADMQDDVSIGDYYLFVTLLNISYWVAGSFIGSLIGGALLFDTKGIDFAMTALFAVIFAEQWEKTKDHIPALTGLALSALSLFFFGSSHFLIPALLLITAALFAEKGLIERRRSDAE